MGFYPKLASVKSDDWRLVASAALLAVAEQAALPAGKTPLLEPATWRRWADAIRWPVIGALNRQVWADATLRHSSGGANPKGLTIGLWILQQLEVEKDDERVDLALDIGSRVVSFGTRVPGLARELPGAEQETLRWISNVAEYHAKTLACVRSLLQGFDESAISRLLRKKPQLGEVIVSRFDEEATPEATALIISTAVLIELIEATDFSTRDAILAQLRARASAGPAQDTVAHSPHAGPAIGLLGALLVADDWRQAGSVSDQECEYLASEVVGSLSGKDANTRQADRLMGFLEAALFPNRAPGPDRRADRDAQAPTSS